MSCMEGIVQISKNHSSADDSNSWHKWDDGLAVLMAIPAHGPTLKYIYVSVRM